MMNRILPVVVLSVLAAGWSVTTLTAAEPVMTIERLNALKSDWATFTASTIRVEGRLSAHLKNRVRLQKCELNFLLSDELDRRVGNAKNLELSGRLRKDGKQFQFEVHDVKSVPSDADQIRSREAALRNPSPADWYELGEWALNRGRFYDDEGLRESARTYFVRGLGLESRGLDKDDIDGRFGVATKAQNYELPPRIVEQLRHEAFLSWRDQVVLATMFDAAQCDRLIERFRTEYPAAATPLSAWPPLAKTYASDPVDTYRQATDEQRVLLQRVFYCETRIARLLKGADPAGTDGDAIAKTLAVEIPERPDLVDQQRERALMVRLASVEKLSREEVLSLMEGFRSRQRPDLAEEAARRWLRDREQKQTVRGAPELVSLSDNYLKLLNDEPTAVARLVEAYRQEPEYIEISDRLIKLGYRLDAGSWVKQAQTKTMENPGRSIEPAVSGQIAAGTSATEVRRRIGQPTRVARVRTAGNFDEFWTYGGAPGTSSLVVHLHSDSGLAEPVVVRVFNR